MDDSTINMSDRALSQDDQAFLQNMPVLKPRVNTVQEKSRKFEEIPIEEPTTLMGRMERGAFNLLSDFQPHESENLQDLQN